MALMQPITNYARRELQAHEALGEIPPGELAPEDIVDVALLDALQHASEAPSDRLYPWLRRFVRRAIEREARQRQRQPREVSLETPLGTQWPDEGRHGPPRRLVDVLPDPTSPIPEQVVESEEFQEILIRLLNELPRSWREPFILHVRDGLPPSRIAKLEGLPIMVVRRRIELAREFLRTRLAEEYEDEAVPPPTESIFRALDQMAPTPEQLARTRHRLQRASAA
jgi:RNA polymerase sigma factor (sigma-70 family)